jgi:hypothetical protein
MRPRYLEGWHQRDLSPQPASATASSSSFLIYFLSIPEKGAPHSTQPMKKSLVSRSLCAAALVVGMFTLSGFASGENRYVITNDDVPPEIISGLSFYSVGSNGALEFQQFVGTFGNGIYGGFFGANRLVTLNSEDQQCAFASEAYSGEIAGVDVPSLMETSIASGSAEDQGTSNGIGLALNSQYLYASFTDSNTIGAFAIQGGCGLTFMNDVSVAGLAGGIVNGMAAHGNILIATYTDGTIESFDISNGLPVSNGDKQYSTATLNAHDATYPNSIDITSDGHFAIFGDTSTSQVVEVSDISSGKLSKTIVHTSKVSISASNVMLSPDETLLYISNTQGDSVSVMFFDKTTGALSAGCTSTPLRGQSTDWSYLAGLALLSNTGNGGGAYVAQFGGPSSIGFVKLTITGKKCSLKEASGSPFSDPDSYGLLSIGSFPPRAF